MRDVVAVADVSQRDLPEIAEPLLQREVVRQRLARMLQIAQRIDHRNRRITRHALDRLLRERPQHDHVHPALQIVRNVAQRLARIQTALRLIDEHRSPAQARHSCFERKPCSQRRLLEEHHHLLPRHANAETPTDGTSSVPPDAARPEPLAVRDRASKPNPGTRRCREMFPAPTAPVLCCAMDCSTLTPLLNLRS